MQLQEKIFLQKSLYARNKFVKIFLFAMNYDKIVGIAHILFYFQYMFHKLIKFVHIDICKQLGGQIANRQASFTLSLSLS